MISSRCSPFPAPTVPNSIPVSHNASAHGRSSFCSCSGRASVAKSRSGLSRPSSASRTEPPTRYSSWPAAANSEPSSRSRSRVRVQGDRGGGQQIGVLRGFGHGESVVGDDAAGCGRCGGPPACGGEADNSAQSGDDRPPTASAAGSVFARQLLSLGCPTAKNRNHVGAGGGAVVGAPQGRPTVKPATPRPTAAQQPARRSPADARSARRGRGATAHRARDVGGRTGHRRYRSDRVRSRSPRSSVASTGAAGCCGRCPKATSS